MRIAYGVHGYSRGHATRALSVLPDLTRRNEVLLFAGGDAYQPLSSRYRVIEVPALGFHYRGGRRSNWRTLANNLPLLGDLFGGGEAQRRVLQELTDFQPDVVISDAEPWTAKAAAKLKLPRISFDHFGVMVHCRPKLLGLDRIKSLVDRAVYLMLYGVADRCLVSSFYNLPAVSGRARVIGPVLRDEVHQVQASPGDHLLVYLNQGHVQLTARVAEALQGLPCEVRVYGSGPNQPVANLRFCGFDNRGFLQDLASARAVVCTAGNQLVGEALHFGKPLLVLPERSVEQRLNAQAVAELGVGEVSSLEQLDRQTLIAFLRSASRYAAVARTYARDGRKDAVEVLEQWFRDLAWRSRRRLVAATA
jgi:uncharacterized protein (TIGR00661 family)